MHFFKIKKKKIQFNFSQESLVEIINIQIKQLLETNSIGLLIIDSVAGIFGVHDKYIERSNNMRTLVRTLLSLSKKHNFSILFINQVRSCMNTEAETAPALGLAWANLITTRLQIYKEESAIKDPRGIKMQKRKLRVIWAPNVGLDEATFFITEQGIS